MAANGSVLHTTGEYEFNGNPFTLTLSAVCDLLSTLRARSYFPATNLLDDAPDFDAIVDFDGTTPTTVRCQVVRANNGRRSKRITHLHFMASLQQMQTFKCRAFELKAEFETNDDTAQISVDQLRVKALMPFRSLSGEVTTSTTGDTTVNFGTGNRFYVKPSIGIIFAASNTTDYYVISNDSSGSSFDISVYNSSDSRIASTVRWNAVGYGRGV